MDKEKFKKEIGFKIKIERMRQKNFTGKVGRNG